MRNGYPVALTSSRGAEESPPPYSEPKRMSVTGQKILEAMAGVMDPELNVSLVKAGMVKDIRVSGGNVKLKIELTTPACPLKGKIQSDTEKAIRTVEGVTGVEVEWGAQVRSAPVG